MHSLLEAIYYASVRLNISWNGNVRRVNCGAQMARGLFISSDFLVGFSVARLIGFERYF